MDEPTQQRLLEWSTWRGRVDQQIKTHADQLSDISMRLTAGFDRLEANFDRRMDKQDRELAAIRSQTTITNGTVIRHTERLDQAEESITSLIAGNAQRRRDGIAETRFRVTTLVSVGAVIGTVAATLLGLPHVL